MTLKHLQEKLAGQIAQVKGYQAKLKDGTLTAEEKTAWKTLNDEMAATKADLEELESLDKSATDTADFASEPVPGNPATKGVTSVPAQVKNDGIVQVLKAEAVGYDTFGYDDDGVFKLLGMTNDELTDKKLKGISSPEYQQGFASWLKAKGKFDMIDRDMQKVLQVGDDEQGGFLAPPQMLSRIISKKTVNPILADMVDKVTTTASSVSMLRWEDDDEHGTNMRHQATREGQDAKRQDPDNLKQFTIPIYTRFTYVPVTRDFVEDSPQSVQRYVTDKFQRMWAMQLERSIWAGTGVNDLMGIVTRATQGLSFSPEIVKIGDDLDMDALHNAYYDLDEAYEENLNIVMRKATFGKLSGVRTSEGNAVFGHINTNTGMVVKPQEVMYGTPIRFSRAVDAMGQDKYVGGYGDFREAYLLAIRLGLSVAIEDLASKGHIKIVFRSRVGGDVTDGNALQVWQQDDAA